MYFNRDQTCFVYVSNYAELYFIKVKFLLNISRARFCLDTMYCLI